MGKQQQECQHTQWTITKLNNAEARKMCTQCGLAWIVKLEAETFTMKKGTVKKLPAASSPMWTQQWAYQGSGRVPYIVSRKRIVAGNMGGFKKDEWACSCPAWTQSTPRENCKHIMKVMLLEKVPMAELVPTLLPKDKQELFLKFLKEQAAAGTPVIESGGVKPIVRQGRRFR